MCGSPDIARDSAEPLSIVVGNETITAHQPITKAALVALDDAWPAAMMLTELCDAARGHEANGARRTAAGERRRSRDLEFLASDLMTLYSRGLLRAWVDPPRVAGHAGEWPRAMPLARLQARQGNLVTNHRHEHLCLTDLSRAVLSRLSGQHDRQALTQWLAEAIGRGEFSVRQGETPLTDIAPVTLDRILDGSLSSLAASSLLVA